MAKRILITCTDSMMKQFLEPHVLNLLENGYEVEIACSEVLNRMTEIHEDLGDYVKIHCVNAHRSPFSKDNIEGYKQIKRIIENGNYDLIWTNEPVMGLLTRLAAKKVRKSGTKVLYMAHGFHFYKGAPLVNWLIYYPIEKWMARYTDKLVCINEEDYCFAKTHLPCQAFHIHGIGANSHRFRPIPIAEQTEKKNSLGLNGFLIISVGELNTNKNQKTAIKAFKEVLNQFPDARLLIAGKGDQQNYLEQLVTNEGLYDKVLFLGYTLELEKYLQIANVMIACSYREGLGLSVIEAMLCGKPVVASHNRGHDELIHEGENGHLVDAEDANAYARRICEIFRTGHDYSNAALLYSQPYTLQAVKQELEDLLK